MWSRPGPSPGMAAQAQQVQFQFLKGLPTNPTPPPQFCPRASDPVTIPSPCSLPFSSSTPSLLYFLSYKTHEHISYPFCSLMAFATHHIWRNRVLDARLPS